MYPNTVGNANSHNLSEHLQLSSAMKIIAFRIQNYKGIKDTTISLKGNKGSIYTLVGLNESGKTTILEAINNFRPDVDGIHAIAQKSISTDPIEALVPKKKKDNFNGDIIVAAEVRFDENDIAELNECCKSKYDFQIDTDKLPKIFWVKRVHEFKNSAHTKTNSVWVCASVRQEKREHASLYM